MRSRKRCAKAHPFSISCAVAKATNMNGVQKTASMSAADSRGLDRLNRMAPVCKHDQVASAVHEALRACAEGDAPPNVALMHLLVAAPDERTAKEALESEISKTAEADN